MSDYLKTDLEFDPTLDTFNAQRLSKSFTALSGGNNSGKSLVLKWLKAKLGLSAYMVGTSRFSHVYHFSSGLRDANRELQEYESQFIQNFWQDQYNYEQNYYNLNQIIIGLSNEKRNTLFSLCGELIGNTFSLKKVDEDNDLSVSFIDMDGQNLSVASTGTRILMTVLGICMDDRFNTVLIDEPELGLSPKVQLALANFLQDSASRLKYFPHLERVFVATHSHIFLSRSDIQSNYIVAKSGKRITIDQVKSVSDFHRLQFNLLGNTLESMFFPSAIVIVEGKTDYKFIDKVLSTVFRNKKITVIQANSDSQITEKVHILKEALGDLSRNPFRNRLFVVLDEVHGHSIVQKLENQGVEPTNIIIWSKNGIEYSYPLEIMMDIYSCAPQQIEQLHINGDVITINGISRTKNELSDEVVNRINESTRYPKEFTVGLLDKLQEIMAD